MAKGAYVGINGVAHNVKDIYVGVNGIAHKVTKGYVGVNGIAQQFWPSGATPTYDGSWNYWSTDTISIQANPSITVTKSNKKIAYYAFIKLPGHNVNSTSPIFLSPDRDACAFSVYTRYGGLNNYGALGTVRDPNGILWYFSGMLGGLAIEGAPEDLLLNNIGYAYSVEGYRQAAQDFLIRIYATPFQANYQTGQTYTLLATDIRKTIRKIFGTCLYVNINSYGYSMYQAYTNFSDNADNIITEVVNRILAKSDINGLVAVEITKTTIEPFEIEIWVLHGTRGSIGQTDRITNASLSTKTTFYHYDFYEFTSPDYPSEHGIYDEGAYPDWAENVSISASGITYSTFDAWDIQTDYIRYKAGIDIGTGSVESYSLTNLGINL